MNKRNLKWSFLKPQGGFQPEAWSYTEHEYAEEENK